MRMIRRCERSKSGWNSGDLDVAFQLFRCGMVWDGNLASKSSRNHLVEHGFAVQYGGFQALTGRGVVHFLTSRAVWRAAWQSWRNWKKHPLVASEAEIRRALT